ncbi:UNVERIFIED_CONTAM: hypothetical protein GTU68_058638 [Idotea baltica]|nr:hypothetical protein [Idotea baltica]
MLFGPASVPAKESLGNRGEQLAACYLKQQKYRILDTQHRNTYGEVDIIAKDGDCIVFVEVKTRSSTEAGRPLEAVDRRKQQRLTRIALAWLKQKKKLGDAARFDVVSIVWREDAEPELQHFQNAFEPIGDGQFFG